MSEPVASQTYSIRCGEVYASQQLLTSLGIARETLDKWINRGLAFARPNTRHQYFLGDDVIRFMFKSD